jgi:hypothetical protein
MIKYLIMPRSKPVFVLGILVLALLSGGHSETQDRSAQNRDFLSPGAFTRIRSDIPEFERLFSRIRETLRRNQVAFRGRRGLIRGFSAGSAYPQIWLRDAATIIPASRFFYTLPYLKSWLIEHLDRQKTNGELQDWLDSRGTADKNTTETDQETSAVHAAIQIAGLIGADWLDERIGEKSLIDRLEKALSFVWEQRRDPGTGLIRGAHTVDWGDVEMEEPDQRAIYTGPGTHWTADIYDQSQFYRSARGVAALLRSKKKDVSARAWETRADGIRRLTDERLWQKELGFYRVHIHITPLRHDFDEDAMFAMGGNAEAIDSGLASADKARLIIGTAMTRQKKFGLSTISGALLPPYAKGVFKHPMVDDPYEYQNGGQWDWFGGKLVLSMFRHTGADKAEAALLEIARKADANNGFFEWDDPQGRGHGSPYYSGSAGSLARALLEGYFGIGLERDKLVIEPRLGRKSGAVHLFVPAAERFIAYSWNLNPDSKRLTLSFNGDWSDRVELRIPWRRIDEAVASDPKSGQFEVRLDGRPASYRIETSSSGEVVLIIDSDLRYRELTIIPLASPAGGIPMKPPDPDRIPDEEVSWNTWS